MGVGVPCSKTRNPGGMDFIKAFCEAAGQTDRINAHLAAYGDGFIFVEQDTASNEELMAQFKTDGCRVILREKAGVYFSTGRLQGGDKQSATNAGATKEDSTKTDAAPAVGCPCSFACPCSRDAAALPGAHTSEIGIERS